MCDATRCWTASAAGRWRRLTRGSPSEKAEEISAQHRDLLEMSRQTKAMTGEEKIPLGKNVSLPTCWLAPLTLISFWLRCLLSVRFFSLFFSPLFSLLVFGRRCVQKKREKKYLGKVICCPSWKTPCGNQWENDFFCCGGWAFRKNTSISAIFLSSAHQNPMKLIVICENIALRWLFSSTAKISVIFQFTWRWPIDYVKG